MAVDLGLGEVDAFLMIGQSNMAGRGDFGEVPEILNDKCFMLRNGHWWEMSEPINCDRGVFHTYGGGDKLHSGVGLAASFADEYAKHYNRNIGLIPCADGASPIVEWMPGEILYDHALMQTRLAQCSSKIKGILWQHGEWDSDTPEHVAAYYDKCKEMMTTLRRDIGEGDIPILMGEIGEFIPLFEHGRFKYSPDLNKVLHQLCRDMPNCKIVSSHGLSARFDGQHFDSKAFRELGVRYFQAYREWEEEQNKR